MKSSWKYGASHRDRTTKNAEYILESVGTMQYILESVGTMEYILKSVGTM